MKYKRILLKLSGEALMGGQAHGWDEKVLEQYAGEVKNAAPKAQIGIVIGGGNIFRGLSGTGKGYDRVRGDYMGMLATIINALALQSAFEGVGLRSRVLTAFGVEPAAERYSKEKAISALEGGEVCILAAGTGNPFFTTDTAAALRAVEIEADALLKGTRVDGIYTADPEKDPAASKFDALGYDEAISKNLRVMDQTAFTMCSENELPIVVFDMNTAGALNDVLDGKKTGTTVK
jgi:uridylate kinase